MMSICRVIVMLLMMGCVLMSWRSMSVEAALSDKRLCADPKCESAFLIILGFVINF